MSVPKLSPEMKDVGKKLLISLDKTEDRPSSMFWFYFESQGWVLCIAPSNYLHGTPEKENIVSQRVVAELSSVTKKDIKFAIVSSREDIILAMSNLFQTPVDLIGQIEVRDNFINGVSIQAAFAYRLSVM